MGSTPYNIINNIYKFNRRPVTGRELVGKESRQPILFNENSIRNVFINIIHTFENIKT